MNYVEPIRSRKLVAKVEDYLACKNERNRLIFAFGVNTIALKFGEVELLICILNKPFFLSCYKTKTPKNFFC